MKKLLSLAFCAAAAAAFAADEITVAEVGVTMIDLPNGQPNTIIAASFKDFADGDISIENLVKTTNLETGAQIIRYAANGTHTAWRLNAEKAWEAISEVTQGAEEGNVTMGTSPDPSATAPTVGEGLWIVRGPSATWDAKIALYGKFIAGRTSTVVANKWNLLGNAGTASYTFSTGTKGDELIVVDHGPLKRYQYGDSGWFYETTETKTVTANGRDWTKVEKVSHQENPTIAAGIGFWYRSATDMTLTWTDVD